MQKVNWIDGYTNVCVESRTQPLKGEITTAVKSEKKKKQIMNWIKYMHILIAHFINNESKHTPHTYTFI